VKKVFSASPSPAAARRTYPVLRPRLPAEYEIARSIRVVARTARKRIGLVTTQVRLMGGLDFNTFQSTPPWPVVPELQKQYEVVQIAPGDSITEKVDALVIAMPSSLSQDEMNHVQDAISHGTPALLIDDPVPVFDVGLAPNEESGAT
jgi:ABC-2 type transport system permease protein